MVFRQLFDSSSSTYTYLLGDRHSGDAVLIDPVFEQVRRDAALVHELRLRLLWTLDTHVHADHVTGAWLLKQRAGSAIALSAASGASGADRLLEHGDRISFGKRYIEARATPGHTSGCLTYVLDDESMAFTGDCLLIRGSGRTDFQQGNPAAMYRSVHERIFTLPTTCLLYPAHDYHGLTVTSVDEERSYNPRLGGDISVEDFTGYMNNLGLPHPKKLDVAVPANLKCGQPDVGQATAGDPQWARLTFTFGGIWELQPQALEEAGERVQIIDVRQPDEFSGALGHIRGAKLIPLDQLHRRVEEIDRTRPVVTVCRSGARSAQAVVMLQKDGFQDLANLAGGMLRWRAEGCSVEGGAA
ncbi:MBL fold metallo-hydrolase [Aromatoleum diolicum]|uniref:MBL fold metallo-hydrolase n=1 Tax=Aromatoleum diolicum TaxID=75796 RepID=A0ABX1Q509_9RHOO|nr:MBL fold metallo-hydrolase [Aromatoleum diolicum]